MKRRGFFKHVAGVAAGLLGLKYAKPEYPIVEDFTGDHVYFVGRIMTSRVEPTGNYFIGLAEGETIPMDVDWIPTGFRLSPKE